jgi:predicted Zn-dependent peptidase
MQNYHCFTLPSGLRVILLPADSEVIYCGFAIAAGTRHEQQGEEGMAHLLEHMSFKGTAQRSSVQIINALEGVGGELNAFTTKEDTVYYAATTRQHLRQAIDVLQDIVFHSTYPQQELEKEREVVCDEIESYEDTPSELIFDEFENLLFKDHPLGHNILGTSSQVRNYQSDDVTRFAHRHYRTDRCVFFASGKVDAKAILRQLESIVPIQPTAPFQSTASIPPIVPSTEIRHRSTHQAHVMLGTATFPATDPRRWSLFLLNNILGGPGLNSRLNLALRERRGLVYTVESQTVVYADTGVWSVYFGCDQNDVDRCLRLVRKELSRLSEKPLSEAQLKRAKQQLHGQLTIGAENREQLAIDQAKCFLHEGRIRTLNEVLSHIDALSPQDLWQVAQHIFSPTRQLTLIYQ